jgi:hypothetical protein
MQWNHACSVVDAGAATCPRPPPHGPDFCIPMHPTPPHPTPSALACPPCTPWCGRRIQQLWVIFLDHAVKLLDFQNQQASAPPPLPPRPPPPPPPLYAPFACPFTSHAPRQRQRLRLRPPPPPSLDFQNQRQAMARPPPLPATRSLHPAVTGARGACSAPTPSHQHSGLAATIR